MSTVDPILDDARGEEEVRVAVAEWEVPVEIRIGCHYGSKADGETAEFCLTDGEAKEALAGLAKCLDGEAKEQVERILDILVAAR